MSTPAMTAGLRAYGAMSAVRSRGAQEADVFYRANGALRAAQQGARMDRVRALADNRLLWTTVLALVYDPASKLPRELRGAIASIGLAVQREANRENPNLDFLISVNENVAAGLSGQGR
jgi:flagellar biosynthesis activator protein FlaF